MNKHITLLNLNVSLCKMGVTQTWHVFICKMGITIP